MRNERLTQTRDGHGAEPEGGPRAMRRSKVARLCPVLICLGVACQSEDASGPDARQAVPAAVTTRPASAERAPGDSDRRCVDLAELPEPPTRTRFVEPRIPDWIRGRRVGDLVYDVVVAETGRVEQIEPTQAPAGDAAWVALDEASRVAIADWRYVPTVVDGRPVRVCMTVSVKVDLRQGPPAPGVAGEPFSWHEAGRFPSGLSFEVAVRTERFVAGPGIPEDDGSIWGIDGGHPTFFVEQLSVEFGDTDVVVPRKYLADVANVSRASLEATSPDGSNQLVVRLEGGDGSGSFVGEFRFRDCLLVERIMKSAEVPEDVWERVEISSYDVGACG